MNETSVKYINYDQIYLWWSPHLDKPTFLIVSLPVGGYKSLNDIIPQCIFELIDSCLRGLGIFSNSKASDPYKIEKLKYYRFGRAGEGFLSKISHGNLVIGILCLAMVSSHLHA